MKTKKVKTLKKVFGARAAKPRVPDYIPTDRENLDLAIIEQQKIEEKATEILGFNPFSIMPQLEKWQKAVQWHGMPDLRKKLHKAKFNLPVLLLHLECMVKRLKSDH